MATLATRIANERAGRAPTRPARGRPERGIDHPEIILPLLEARLEYIEAAFFEADRCYGGMAGYLREGIGLTEEDLESLRTMLVTDG
jgi:protein-tyrosine phosphatase